MKQEKSKVQKGRNNFELEKMWIEAQIKSKSDEYKDFV